MGRNMSYWIKEQENTRIRFGWRGFWSLTFLFLIMVEETAWAEEEEIPAAGAPMAVSEYTETNGMKLSEKAIKTIEIEYFKISASSDITKIPSSCIVYYGENTGVYRYREGWFKLVKVKELKTGDQVVSQGAPLLRVAEMEVSSAAEESGGNKK